MGSFVKGKENGGKSLLGKIRSRYAVSVAETNEQDIHQTIVIVVAAIVAHAAQADSMLDDILAFVETSGAISDSDIPVCQ